jgi:glycosyltransferase involved in cell wall biosynthesis
MMSGQAVLFYDHFYPDFTAGGPVTSLVNLSQALKGIQVRIVTSVYSFQPRAKLSGVKADCWTPWHNASVWYATSPAKVWKALSTVEDSRAVFYLNGMFSPSFFLLPLLFAKRHTRQVIICPRGMLQPGALKNGFIKKKLYLSLLRLSGLLKNVRWHGTDSQEAADVKRWFGNHQVVDVILNLPKEAPAFVPPIEKQSGGLNLVYYSLVTKKKNLGFLLSLLNDTRLQAVHLDIIGPVKDAGYWDSCQKLIKDNGLAGRVVFQGEKTPEEGLAAIRKYHALVLPTQGENFGHAIVEMVSCSRPVLISDTTPWTDVNGTDAGYAVPLEEDQWKGALEKMLGWDQVRFDSACQAASDYYRKKFNRDKLTDQYLQLLEPVDQ